MLSSSSGLHFDVIHSEHKRCEDHGVMLSDAEASLALRPDWSGMMSWQDWHDDYQTFIWHFQFTSRLYLHWASISTISNFIFRVGLFMPQHITSDQNRIIHRLIRRAWEINSHSPFKAAWPVSHFLSKQQQQSKSVSGFNLNSVTLLSHPWWLSRGWEQYLQECLVIANHGPSDCWPLIGCQRDIQASDWSE